jgi:hypothetical protein
MNWVSAQVAPPSRTTTSRLTASNFCSEFTPSWPPSGSPKSQDLTLQVYLQIRMIMDSRFKRSRPSKFIAKFGRLWAWSATPNSLYYSLQVHLRMHSIKASKCISKLARLCPPSVHHHGLQWISKLAQSLPQSTSLCLLDHSVVTRWSYKKASPTATPHMASNGSAWDSLVLDPAASEEGGRIWRDIRPWWTT